MGEDRPEKKTVRRLWTDLVTEVEGQGGSVPPPLYLTLSGASGKDIEVLVERGLVQRTETGAIDPQHQHKFIAVESNSNAVLTLQRKFPGLKILEVSFPNLVRSASPTAWPDKQDQEFCRARVINLDLNATLVAADQEGQVVFPLLSVVRKLGQIHGLSPQLDWHLCLTLHGEIHWNEDVGRAMQEFLVENCGREPEFAKAVRKLLGDALFDQVTNLSVKDLHGLNVPEQQKLLMVLVPKKIAQLVLDQGWRLATLKNLRYGGTSGRAPMVTWVLHFAWDRRATRTPNAVYCDGLKSVLAEAGQIAEDGTIGT
jgi:hypothetical protein